MSAEGQQEPSMEDILASIRKILSEDDAEPAKPAAPEPKPEPPKAAPPPPPPPPPPPEPEPEPEREPTPVFAAEPEPEPEPEPAESIFDQAPEPEPIYDPNLHVEPEQPLQLTNEMYAQPEAQQQYHPVEHQQMAYPPQDFGPGYGQGLVADHVEAASSASIAGLAQAVARERALALGNQGLTLEQLVREICTPILKQWLDTNLPYMVERIVKQEIERIVSRSERM